MTKRNEIYKCEMCGVVSSVIDGGMGAMSCCGKLMVKFDSQLEGGAASEKHVPVLEIMDGHVKVTVGSTLHPMEETHYIELIQLMDGDDVVFEKRLMRTDEPVAEFFYKGKDLSARAFCNVHGLWSG